MKIKNLDKVDFNSIKLKSEWNDLEKRNKELMESTKVDLKSLSKRFDV